MSQPTPATRRQGACLECRKAKRKCDQRSPQCTQCLKKRQTCSLQVFKIKTIENSQSSSSRRACIRSKATVHSNRSAGGIEGETNLDIQSPDSESRSSTSEGCAPTSPYHAQSPSLVHSGEELYSPIFYSPRLSRSYPPVLEGDYFRGLISGDSPTSSGAHVWIESDGEGETGIIAPANESGPAFTYQAPSNALTGRPASFQRGLSYQLPSAVLNSTVRRLLWDYFVNRTLQVFLCWEPEDVRLDRRYNDPYKDHIPAVVVGSRPMMLASLALSAFHCAGGRQGREDDSLITSLMFEASSALAASHRNQPRMAEEFLSTIGTASFLYLLKPSIYPDMLKLSRSAAICLMTDTRWQNTENPSYQAIMQIFRWSDICAQCSLKRYVPIPDEHTQLCLEVRENERATDLSSTYASWSVHPLYAFAEDMITPLSRVAWLIRLRQQGCVGDQQQIFDSPDISRSAPHDSVNSATTSDSEAVRISSSRFKNLIEETEQTIQFASGRVLSARDRATDQSMPSAPDLETELERLATAMDSTVVILFYTRLKDMPWTSSLVRFHVRNVIESLRGVAASSRFTNGIVFPLFTAGLEAIDSHDREVAVEKIKDLPGIWSQREGKLVSCLKHIWELRDLNPGAVWNSWVHQVPAEYEDLIPS